MSVAGAKRKLPSEPHDGHGRRYCGGSRRIEGACGLYWTQALPLSDCRMDKHLILPDQHRRVTTTSGAPRQKFSWCPGILIVSRSRRPRGHGGQGHLMSDRRDALLGDWIHLSGLKNLQASDLERFANPASLIAGLSSLTAPSRAQGISYTLSTGLIVILDRD